LAKSTLYRPLGKIRGYLFSREGVLDRVHATFRRICAGRIISTLYNAIIVKSAGIIVERHLSTHAGRAERYDYRAGVLIREIGVSRRTTRSVDRCAGKLVE